MWLDSSSLAFLLVFGVAAASPFSAGKGQNNEPVSQEVYTELEELARVVEISYCVGSTGVHKPFKCLSRCNDFPHFELIETWNTGILLSDSSGYIALDHSSQSPRIIVAFRGTYSLSNTVADLSTIPQDYTVYPDDSSNSSCANCTVHTGFYTCWQNTRDAIIDTIETAIKEHPTYRLTLVGHSLGGAVALLASLEFLHRGWTPLTVTTFGQPRVGNADFVKFVDKSLVNGSSVTLHRVTHVDDPVPHLPLTEWGYMPHAGEVYISSADLPPKRSEVVLCDGDSDVNCIAGADASLNVVNGYTDSQLRTSEESSWWEVPKRFFPSRYRLGQVFFSHRDYFSRMGFCGDIDSGWPGGDWKAWFESDHSNDL